MNRLFLVVILCAGLVGCACGETVTPANTNVDASPKQAYIPRKSYNDLNQEEIDALAMPTAKAAICLAKTMTKAAYQPETIEEALALAKLKRPACTHYRNEIEVIGNSYNVSYTVINGAQKAFDSTLLDAAAYIFMEVKGRKAKLNQ